MNWPATLFCIWAFLTAIGVACYMTAPHGWQDSEGWHGGEPGE